VARGEFYGLLGPNGAGKTTTIRMLTGLTKPSSGTAKVAGRDCTREALSVKQRIGGVSEVSNLYNDNNAQLKQHFGWRADSRIASVYVHLR
jgi:ABC-2 type transport system ATP-binding protein